MLGDSLKHYYLKLQQHCCPPQFAGNYAQIGILLLPLLPSFGALAITASLLIILQQYRRIIHRPLTWGMASLATFLVITTSFASNRGDAFLGLFNFLPFFILFAGFSELIRTPNQLRRISWLLVISSLPVVIIGLGQLFLGWVSPLSLQPLLGWHLALQGNPPGRMSSIFLYANILAGYLVVVFILGLGLLLEKFPGISLKKPNYFTLMFLSVATIGNLAAIILTNSRNAWAIAITALLSYAIYHRWRWIIMAVSGIFCSIILAAFAPSPLQELFRKIVPAFFWARLTDQLYPDRPISLLRTTQWKFAWDLTIERPWTGWGLRNFTALYEAKTHLWLGHPHNFFLMLTAEVGIPTTLLFCSLVGGVIMRAIVVVIGDRHQSSQDKLIFFSYILAFLAIALFNTVDVTLFDFRSNTLNWIILSAIWGVTSSFNKACMGNTPKLDPP
ncbi:O-antigen ligase family protein [Synechocystis sp. PCC 7509]|uniref:O-antigen ligase family protein n=1 Tax=Synechocystis sp. PCC 7509 TaxID=927677 RepID=UPI0002AC0724|nr:O-antigen ligase family protein [Synechocystis sp. PCC 7509]